MGRAVIDYHYNLSSLHFKLMIELVQPFVKKCPIRPRFLLRSISAREVTNQLEAFPMTNIEIFSSTALDVAIPDNRTLLCFPPEKRLPRNCKDFDGTAL